ncbi:Origin recognition complex subunit 4 [Smittium mucronatum]|uniref:Origin recognition complex subunit 4 n=1 Tax=Smittium mucronatum TaxID=133383 RepID=A0A1R0GW71_9FUNG|nr:Origin recognition complex subunit 4 [Smittium mucronatum]
MRPNSFSTVEERQIQNAKNIIKRKLSGKEIPQLVGVEKQHQTLYNVLERTVRHGESNSILILGPRGSGKTTVISL